jgi:hypothetical protein
MMDLLVQDEIRYDTASDLHTVDAYIARAALGCDLDLIDGTIEIR